MSEVQQARQVLDYCRRYWPTSSGNLCPVSGLLEQSVSDMLSNWLKAELNHVQQQLADANKRIAELEPLAKCAIELRTWFLDNEFWNDENSEDIFPILEKHGLVECVEYDPAIHNCDNNEPGDTIWYFPPLAGESV